MNIKLDFFFTLNGNPPSIEYTFSRGRIEKRRTAVICFFFFIREFPVPQWTFGRSSHRKGLLWVRASTFPLLPTSSSLSAPWSNQNRRDCDEKESVVPPYPPAIFEQISKQSVVPRKSRNSEKRKNSRDVTNPVNKALMLCLLCVWCAASAMLPPSAMG